MAVSISRTSLWLFRTKAKASKGGKKQNGGPTVDGRQKKKKKGSPECGLPGLYLEPECVGP